MFIKIACKFKLGEGFHTGLFAAANFVGQRIMEPILDFGGGEGCED